MRTFTLVIKYWWHRCPCIFTSCVQNKYRPQRESSKAKLAWADRTRNWENCQSETGGGETGPKKNKIESKRSPHDSPRNEPRRGDHNRVTYWVERAIQTTHHLRMRWQRIRLDHNDDEDDDDNDYEDNKDGVSWRKGQNDANEESTCERFESRWSVRIRPRLSSLNSDTADSIYHHHHPISVWRNTPRKCQETPEELTRREELWKEEGKRKWEGKEGLCRTIRSVITCLISGLQQMRERKRILYRYTAAFHKVTWTDDWDVNRTLSVICLKRRKQAAKEQWSEIDGWEETDQKTEK